MSATSHQDLWQCGRVSGSGSGAGSGSVCGSNSKKSFRVLCEENMSFLFQWPKMATKCQPEATAATITLYCCCCCCCFVASLVLSRFVHDQSQSRKQRFGHMRRRCRRMRILYGFCLYCEIAYDINNIYIFIYMTRSQAPISGINGTRPNELALWSAHFNINSH